MKETKRLKLSRWQTLEHYFPAMFMLIAPAILLFGLFEIFVTKTYDGGKSAGELMTAATPMMIVSIVIYFIQKRRLKFFEVKTEYTIREFQEALQRTSREYEWEIEVNNKELLRARRSSHWTGAWGEVITIIKDKDRLLLNSVCDPDKWSAVTSFGWDKRNINTFLKNLDEVKSGVPEQQKEIDEPEKEWSFKRIVIRIFAYPFCFLFIGLGFFMIIQPVNLVTPFAGLGMISIAGVYIYSDIKMIMK